MPGSPPATAKDGIPESVATIRITGTLRLPLAHGRRPPKRQLTSQPATDPAK
jgi:hypothetical protein